MKISIVSPVYNKEKFLEKHIDSLVNQTYTDIEFIFVNDGSTDNSLEILNQYKKKYDRIILINQENQGPNIARKNGFLKATGDYVYFVDSDDVLYDNQVVSRIVNIITNNTPDCILAQMITRYDNKDVLDKCLYDNHVIEKKYGIDNLYDKLFRGNLSSKIFKKDKIEENYFINRRNYEDCFLTYCILNNCDNYYYLDTPIYIINRKNENNLSITSNMNFDYLKSKYEIIDLLLEKCINFKYSIEKLQQKMYLDDLNYSIRLKKEDTKKLLNYLKRKKLKFNISYAISNHYRKIIVLRNLYICYYSNRIIKYVNDVITILKSAIRKGLK